jgi:thiamine pyrophosphate-dependent acetolactate synthase large subunit-like protein
VNKGWAANPAIEGGKRPGYDKKAANLRLRLDTQCDDVLRFATDFEAGLTNDQGERHRNSHPERRASMRKEELVVPVATRPAMRWGSDAIAHLLATLGLPYVSLVPGASYRGLHDSIVNYLGNSKPSIVLCLHEEHAVAIAHGYAKVTGQPMAAALHSNVGLMHATMAIFNAYCDRAPMLVLGATGPLDAAQRRPWIDWIHTAADQGALIRNYCKWDDQPASVEAALESIARANLLTNAYPQAPTYVCLDATLQEAALGAGARMPSFDRCTVPMPPAPSSEAVDRVADALRTSRRPVVLVGRVGRSQAAFDARVRLVERLGACAVTDLKTAGAFPTKHRLHPAPPGTRLSPAASNLVRRSDLVLSLDWIDLAGTLAGVLGEWGGNGRPTVISCTNDLALHNGWSKDHFQLAAVDISITAHPDLLVDALLASTVDGESRESDEWPGCVEGAQELDERGGDEITMHRLAAALRSVLAGHDVTYTGLPLGWNGGDLDVVGPLDYLGRDGGGGVGSGPGIAVGAALALEGLDRLPVAVLGDGDFLMGSSALWTAAHHRLPLLVVVVNNRSYFNDEVHQETVATMRGRPVENRSVGLHLRDPDPDLAALARSLGLSGRGPCHDANELKAVLQVAVAEALAGDAVVVDVLVGTSGYPGNQERRREGRSS